MEKMLIQALLLVSFCSSIANAGCYCDYNYDECDCDTYIYMHWWFWMIVVVVSLLKFTCIGCYIRRRRMRMQMHYIPTTVQATTTTRTTVAGQRAIPHPQQNMPPPYPGNVPMNYPHGMGPAVQASVPSHADTRIEKDTKMLVA